MFDLATRPQPSTDPATVLGVPFDLCLVTPAPATSYPYTSYVNATAAPQPGVEQLATYSLMLEDSLVTAVVLSLFTDRRADDDAVLPLHQTDRRGWVGDEFATDGFGSADPWGSTLWLLYSGKVTDDVLEQARFAAQESLDWLVRDGIASRVVVTAQWVGAGQDRLAVRPTIYQAGETRPIYDVLWGTSITKWASQ